MKVKYVFDQLEEALPPGHHRCTFSLEVTNDEIIYHMVVEKPAPDPGEALLQQIREGPDACW